MTSKLRPLSRLNNGLKAFFPSTNIQTRAFSACQRCRTDGVYRELTAMRTRVPFIEAFRKEQNEGTKASPIPTEKVERDLSPKSMSDSETRIVSYSHVTIFNLSS